MPGTNHPETGGRGAFILLVLLALGLAGALLWMLNLRLGTGDSYPIYSSFRADPLGTRAIYQALDELPGTTTVRHTRPIKRLQVDGQSAILFLGLNPAELTIDEDSGEREIIDGWMEQGARLVVSLQSAPESYDERMERRKNQRKDTNDSEAPTTDADDTSDHDGKPKEPESFYGLTAKRAPSEESRMQSSEGGVHGSMMPDWHGSHFLVIEPDSGWMPIAYVGDQVTIAWRECGDGAMVVASDSYPFSNEAQVHHRQSEFLLSLLGDRKRIIFDESHLGVSNNPGVMSLVRRYHLHGVVVGGLVLFLLLLWQGGGSLIPVDPNKDFGTGVVGAVAGRDSADGLVALLEAGLKPRAALEECIDRHLAVASVRPPSPEAVESARSIAAQTRNGKLAEDYSRIAKLLDRSHK